MPIQNRNVLARADISPEKIGWVAGRRLFAEDFEDVNAGDITTNILGFAALATGGAGATSATTVQGGAAATNSIARVSAGSGGGVARADLFTDGLWGGPRNPAIRVLIRDVPTLTSIRVKIGFGVGVTIVTHDADGAFLSYDVALSPNWRLYTNNAGAGAVYVDTGVAVVAATTYDFEVELIDQLVRLSQSGAQAALSATAAVASLRTWRGVISVESTVAVARTVDVDAMSISERRTDL